MAAVTRFRADLVAVFTKEPSRAAILTGLAPDPRGTGTTPGHMVTGTTILTGTVLTASTAIEPHWTRLVTEESLPSRGTQTARVVMVTAGSILAAVTGPLTVRAKASSHTLIFDISIYQFILEFEAFDQREGSY